MKNTYTTRQLAVVLLSLIAILPQDLSAQTYASIPYTTGFESGALDASWTAVSTQTGTNIEVIQSGVLTWSTQTAYSHTGNYFLGMDYGTGGVYNLNQADLHLNTAGSAGLRLKFWWAEWNDETEIEDGIYVSDNGGTTFTKILDLDGTGTTDLVWTFFDMSLDSINALYGLSFTSNYIVRFQQYDNYYFAGGNDGFLFDDIEVSSNCSPSAGSIGPVSCVSYTVPSGDETYTTSGNYMDTIPNATGCDSIININLTILNATSSSITESACDVYTSAGGIDYMASGVFTEMYTNAEGCDSTVTLNITITNSSSSSITETAVDSYTAPSGAVYTSTGIYMDTISNAAGCDSVITIDLFMDYTGITESNQELVNVYPNPTNGPLHIDGLAQLTGVASVQVYDMKGRIAMEMENGTSEFSIATLDPGVYYLIIQHEQGLNRIQIVKQ